jgi:hypothetical protein
MKKFLKIFLTVIAVIFLLLLVTPFLFKGKIIEIAKRELNKMLTAQVDFTGVKLSFIRNFPNAYVALEGLTVVGTGEFEGDTLVSFEKFSATVDIKSVISMKNIEIKSVLLDKARVYAHVLENGRANWDIMTPGDESEPEEEESTETDIKISLKKFEIRDAGIVYRDDSSQMAAVLKNLDFNLKGDMAMDRTDLELGLTIGNLSFWMDGIRMMKNARVAFHSVIGADMKNMGFTFKDNEFKLNDIVLKFAGTVSMPEDDIDIDVSFATEKTEFKSLLSLIPAIYMKDFETVKTTGTLALNGNIKGVYNDKRMPDIQLELGIDNAMFKYPDLPKSVDRINAAVKLFYDGEVFDRTSIDVDEFHFEMAGNPFDMGLHIRTPDSDMQLAGKFVGKIDFNSISEIVPLDSTVLTGVLDCNLTLEGRMSTLEKEKYEDFKADGMLKLTGFELQYPGFPQGVKISQTRLNFTPKKVDLVNFDAVIGHTDVALNGTLENFIPYVFKDETIRGKLDLKSNTIDLNELMGEDTAEEAAPGDTVPLSVVEVPKNIDFTLNAKIGNILFDRLDITNTIGMLFVKDGKVRMHNLGMNLLDGSMVLNGEYNTQDMGKPSVDFQMDIMQFDITSAISSFSMLEKIFPEPQDYVGKVSANLTFAGLLDEEMSPVLNSIFSKGQLRTNNIEIRNSKLFGTLADLLKNEKLRTVSPGNLNIKFEVRDGKVLIDPFQLNVSQSKIDVSGSQGLDMAMDYNIKVSVPTSAVGAADLLSKIPGGSGMKEMKITGHIGGTVTSPKVKLSVADMVGELTDAVKEQVTEVVTRKVEEAKEQIKEEINKQADNLVAEAEKQAQNMRDGAKKAADKIRIEAEKSAKKLENDAESKSTIEKRLAKAAADKIRNDAENSAKKLEEESEKNALKTLEAARKKADELRSK